MFPSSISFDKFIPLDQQKYSFLYWCGLYWYWLPFQEPFLSLYLSAIYWFSLSLYLFAQNVDHHNVILTLKSLEKPMEHIPNHKVPLTPSIHPSCSLSMPILTFATPSTYSMLVVWLTGRLASSHFFAQHIWSLVHYMPFPHALHFLEAVSHSKVMAPFLP